MVDDIDDVVDRDNAFQMAGFVDDRQRQELVPRHESSGLFLIHKNIGFDRVGDHHLAERAVGRSDHQISNRHHADEFAGVIDDVEIEKCFQLAALANFVDGALRRRIGRERHEIGGHDSADRTFGIIDQLAHGGLALWIKQG